MTRSAEVDQLAGALLRYVLACQPLHDRLRDAATQLGGVALMVMSRRDKTFDLEQPRRIAAGMIEEIGDALGALPVPDGAAHHFHHMTAAAEALRRVAELLAPAVLARLDDAGRIAISGRLRATTDHLRYASAALPGFEMADLAQSCCAAHGARALPAGTTTELKF